jgi:hypothetical protein
MTNTNRKLTVTYGYIGENDSVLVMNRCSDLLTEQALHEWLFVLKRENNFTSMNCW